MGAGGGPSVQEARGRACWQHGPETAPPLRPPDPCRDPAASLSLPHCQDPKCPCCSLQAQRGALQRQGGRFRDATSSLEEDLQGSSGARGGPSTCRTHMPTSARCSPSNPRGRAQRAHLEDKGHRTVTGGVRGDAGHPPEGRQVLRVSHGGVEATGESHVDVEAHARPCAHLGGGEKHVAGPGPGTSVIQRPTRTLLLTCVSLASEPEALTWTMEHSLTMRGSHPPGLGAHPVPLGSAALGECRCQRRAPFPTSFQEVRPRGRRTPPWGDPHCRALFVHSGGGFYHGTGVSRRLRACRSRGTTGERTGQGPYPRDQTRGATCTHCLSWRKEGTVLAGAGTPLAQLRTERPPCHSQGLHTGVRRCAHPSWDRLTCACNHLGSVTGGSRSACAP